MKTTLESLKKFVESVSGKHPNKLPAILACVENHWNENLPAIIPIAEVWEPRSVFVEMSKRFPKFTADMRAISVR